jgi:hypothetical protein
MEVGRNESYDGKRSGEGDPTPGLRRRVCQAEIARCTRRALRPAAATVSAL